MHSYFLSNCKSFCWNQQCILYLSFIRPAGLSRILTTLSIPKKTKERFHCGYVTEQFYHVSESTFHEKFLPITLYNWSTCGWTTSLMDFFIFERSWILLRIRFALSLLVFALLNIQSCCKFIGTCSKPRNFEICSTLLLGLLLKFS